uniref:Protein-serine/threonine kinase n=1 Tax=Alexandrium monilatum TaxID=311494 RepID=A0A7S4R496_9DINO
MWRRAAVGLFRQAAGQASPRRALLRPSRHPQCHWPQAGRLVAVSANSARVHRLPVGEEDIEDQHLAEQIAHYAAMRPNPLSLGKVLEMMTPWLMARFIYKELPIRYAERIRSIEALPGWDTVPDLAEVRRRHVRTFEDIIMSGKFPNRSSLGDPDLLVDFNQVVRSAAVRQTDVQLLTARAMHTLHRQNPDTFSVGFIDKWLDDFLLNWIGTEMLLAHYLACVHGQPTGIVDPRCDVAEVCRDVAFTMQRLCQDLRGRVPPVQVLSRSALEEDDLKLQKRPITVLVCADERRVAIRISDLARGIPFDVGAHVWSYMYSTARKQGESATPIAGYGVGLPLSRLYARYLGGSLDLISWPGYGTDVHLFLPRLTSEQVEVVPDQDNEDEWTHDRVSQLVGVGPQADAELKDFVDWVFNQTAKERA